MDAQLFRGRLRGVNWCKSSREIKPPHQGPYVAARKLRAEHPA
jgi:hypothetical protein